MTLSEAHYLAESIIAKLMPVTFRIQICGSVRRKKKEVSDLDLVLVPHRDAVKDMFGNVTGTQVAPEFARIINQWTKIKGEADGKYTQRIVDGHKVEFTMCQQDNFGVLQIIRTGDSEFTHMLMKRVNKMGLEQRDGYLWRDDNRLTIEDEKDYFRILELPYIEPENRNADAFKRLPAR